MFTGPVRQAVRPPGSRHGRRAAPAGNAGLASAHRPAVQATCSHNSSQPGAWPSVNGGEREAARRGAAQKADPSATEPDWPARSLIKNLIHAAAAQVHHDVAGCLGCPRALRGSR